MNDCGLIDVHICHLLLGLSGLLLGRLCLLCLLLFLCSLLVLYALELIEDILIVEQCVREFVTEGVSGQESLDSPLNDRNFEQLVDVGSLIWF